MAYIRNNIEIEGINNGENINYGSYVLNHWENGPIFLPKSKGKIKYLTKVIIELNSIEGKVITTAAGRVLNIYGRRLYTLIYSEKSHDRSQKTYLDLPFLAYVYLPPDVNDFCNLEVGVSDAFFEVIDNRKVYNHVLYIIKFDKKEKEEETEDSNVNLNINESGEGQLTLSDLEKMIMNSPLKDILNKNLVESKKDREEEENIESFGLDYKEENNKIISENNREYNLSTDSKDIVDEENKEVEYEDEEREDDIKYEEVNEVSDVRIEYEEDEEELNIGLEYEESIDDEYGEVEEASDIKAEYEEEK